MEIVDDYGLEDKFFGEYFQKRRVKYDGHSFKRSSACGSQHKQPLIERKALNDKKGEIEVTELDTYFDPGFIRGSFGLKQQRTLNSPEKWEEVEDHLKEKAIRTSQRFDRYLGMNVSEYDIPISGYLIEANAVSYGTKKKKVKNEKWFYWKGKYYDPEYLYQFHNSYQITKLCPLKKGIKDLQLSLGRIDSKLTRIAARSFIASKSFNNRKKQNIFMNNHQTSSKKAIKSNQYVEFDLGRIFELDHIGTLGGYPREITIFPDYGYRYATTHVNPLNHSKPKDCKSFIYVVKNSNSLSWVKNYKLYYRDLLTGQWFLYDTTFTGNDDIQTEVRHSISIIARFVRVVPLEYHNMKEFRVALYGKPYRSHTEAHIIGNGTNLIKQQRNYDQNDSVCKEIRTVRYSITPAVSSSLILDGFSNGNDVLYYHRPRKNTGRYQLIQDELNAYYDEEEKDYRNI